MSEEIAKLLYNELEGPVNNQDASRQKRQWDMCLRIAGKIAPLDDAYADVDEFHCVFGHPRPGKPKLLDRDLANRRFGFMAEELEEFLEARTIADQADAMIDLIYFALGTLVCMGVRPGKLWNIVHRANMSKAWEDGPHKDPTTGKTIKPPGWVAPEPLLQLEIEEQSNV